MPAPQKCGELPDLPVVHLLDNLGPEGGAGVGDLEVRGRFLRRFGGRAQLVFLAKAKTDLDPA